MNLHSHINAVNLFHWVARSRRLNWSIAAFLFVLACVGFIRFEKDTSVDSFIPPGHESLATRDAVRDIFGLSDPIVIALDTGQPDGIYSPQGLNDLARVEATVKQMAGVRQDRVVSILSEASIAGDGFSLLVDDVASATEYDEADAERVRRLVERMPMLTGVLVSEDRSAALIIVELLDQRDASDVYEAVRDQIDDLSLDTSVAHIAGAGAITGYLSHYIDQDAQKLQPLVLVVIIVVLFMAFRSIKAVAAPLVVIVASAVGTIGTMSWLGVPYFAITGALPVVIVAIAVADSIHILTAYLAVRVRQPQLDAEAAIVDAMSDIWVPITLTTLTTAAGFVGLSLSSVMPPIQYFGYFAALGVVLAWALSMFVLPTLITHMDIRPSEAYARVMARRPRWLATLHRLAVVSASRPFLTLGIMVVLVSGISLTATGLRFDRLMIEHFSESESIRVADTFISDNFAGTSYLDIMITAEQADDLLRVDLMEELDGLHQFMGDQEGVGKVISMLDYFKVLHTAIDPETSTTLPEIDDAYAQYMLLYESSADPADFEEEIDGDYQHLLVRVYMKSGMFSRDARVVQDLERYLENHFDSPLYSAQISGRVNVDYHWMATLEDSHYRSVIVTLILVIAMAIVIFKSAGIGVLAGMPVILTVIGVYALMTVMGLYLEPATSMFASIAIGIGVDFAIHLIDRALLDHDSSAGHRGNHRRISDVVRHTFSLPIRACAFNAMTLGLGFSVLLASELMTLSSFGALVSFASLISFFAALVLIPMCLALREPRAPKLQPMIQEILIND